MVYEWPSTPGTLTAAIDSNGTPDLSRAFITLEGKDGEEDTIICLGSDVPITTYCVKPDVGTVAWGGLSLPQTPVGADGLRIVHAIVYYPGAPDPAGTSGLSPLYIPPH